MVETQWGSYITVAISGFVAVVVGTEQFKKRMHETEDALVPPALEAVSPVRIRCHFLLLKVREDLVVAELRKKRIWLGNLKKLNKLWFF